jgi:hypothetical protein
MQTNLQNIKNNFIKPLPLQFNLLFVSLIAPNFTHNFTNFFSYKQNVKKIQLKQSYLIFTWFFYFSSVSKNKKTLKIFILPKKKKITTQLKAPIAHKNWSKEQFNFQYFLICLKFKANLQTNQNINSINNGLFVTLMAKNNIPVFETNNIFLKNFRINYLINDSNYFNYNKYNKNNKKK